MRIRGRILEPCVGDGAIVRAAGANDPGFEPTREWFTNDLDPSWPCDSQLDAATPALRNALAALGIQIDWSVSNPPFSPAVDIINEQLEIARVGVAMHLRASIHEVLKKDKQRRTWLAERPPTGILWLPRFGYQRSQETGKWSTDSVCACWCIWMKDPAAPQFVRYAPERVLDELDAFTPAYRERTDALMLARDPEGYGALLELGRPKGRRRAATQPALLSIEVSA